MRKSRNYWNKENSFEAASRFKNKRDFKKAHMAAYELLRINGWLEESCSHMKKPENPNIKWTYENCKREALKYTDIYDFRMKMGRAYMIARKNGWLNDICSHMKILKRPNRVIFWTKEKCRHEGLKYMNRNDFHLNSPKAYAACVRNKWINEVCSHMNAPYTIKFIWSYEKCRLVALKYSNKTDFYKNDKSAYMSAKYNRWLNDICKHMVRCGDRKHKCIYSYEFSDNHVYVGLTYNINIRDKSRRYEKRDAVVLHIEKTNLIPMLKQLTDYVPVNLAIRLEGEYLQKYIDGGWIALNRDKTGSIGGYNNVWNFSRVKKITSKYENSKSFMEDDTYLYEIAKKAGWIYSLFPDEI